MLAHQLRVLGAAHPRPLVSRHHLAYAYQAAGRPGKAISQYKKVLAHQLRVLGASHP